MIRELADVMGIRSTNGVSDHLRALRRKGYLERAGLELRSRALRLIQFNYGESKTPIFGAHPAQTTEG